MKVLTVLLFFCPAFCLALPCVDLIAQTQAQQGRLLKKLQLTAEQKNLIEKQKKTHDVLISTQLQKVHAAQTEVLTVLEKNAPTEVIRERVMNLEHEREALHATQVDLALAVREVLSPEQKQKAVAELKLKSEQKCD